MTKRGLFTDHFYYFWHCALNECFIWFSNFQYKNSTFNFYGQNFSLLFKNGETFPFFSSLNFCYCKILLLYPTSTGFNVITLLSPTLLLTIEKLLFISEICRPRGRSGHCHWQHRDWMKTHSKKVTNILESTSNKSG